LHKKFAPTVIANNCQGTFMNCGKSATAVKICQLATGHGNFYALPENGKIFLLKGICISGNS